MFPAMTERPWSHIWSENSPILRGRSQARPEGEGGSLPARRQAFCPGGRTRGWPPRAPQCPWCTRQGSAAIHSRPGSPVAQARAYPGSRGGPTAPAGVGHRPPFQAGARFSETGTRQHPCSGGGSTDTTSTHPGLAVKARTGRPEAGAGSHPRTGGRPPEPTGIGPGFAGPGKGRGNSQRRDRHQHELLGAFHRRSRREEPGPSKVGAPCPPGAGAVLCQ